MRTYLRWTIFDLSVHLRKLVLRFRWDSPSSGQDTVSVWRKWPYWNWKALYWYERTQVSKMPWISRFMLTKIDKISYSPLWHLSWFTCALQCRSVTFLHSLGELFHSWVIEVGWLSAALSFQTTDNVRWSSFGRISQVEGKYEEEQNLGFFFYVEIKFQKSLWPESNSLRQLVD